MQASSPRSIWNLIDAVSVLLARAYMTARARTLGHPSPVVRLLAQRDHAYTDSVLLERELAIFRSQRHRYPAKRRPHFLPKNGQRSQLSENTWVMTLDCITQRSGWRQSFFQRCENPPGIALQSTGLPL